MKYIAVDIESTGLNPETCQVIEFAAVVETGDGRPVEELPTVHWLVEHDLYAGEPAALGMNARVWAELAKPRAERACPTVRADFLAWELIKFYVPHFGGGRITLAGKNVGAFDLAFLRRLPGWPAERFRHRVLDPGCLWLSPDDEKVPDTAECLKRAGLVNDRPHHPVADCVAVIEMIRAWEVRHGR